MKIEIWSDIACPWCYIGSFRLDAALRTFPHGPDVQIVHRSFELNPDHLQDETMPVLEMFARRYGVSPEQARGQEEQLQRIANAEGLPFSLGRAFGNTRWALELVHLAAEHGVDHELMQLLYREHFGGSGNVFTIDGLLTIAQHVGLDRELTRATLEDGRYTAAVRADEAEARAFGITGVPFFLIDRTFALSGGQSVAAMSVALARAWDETHGPTPVSAPPGRDRLRGTERRHTRRTPRAPNRGDSPSPGCAGYDRRVHGSTGCGGAALGARTFVRRSCPRAGRRGSSREGVAA